MRRFAIATCLLFSFISLGGKAVSMDHRTAAFAYAHHPIAAANEHAQVAFDRGLTLLYAFERLAARRAFEDAAKADPKCAMAQWGIAMSLGSNINVPIDAAGEQQAYAAIARALELAPNANELDRAWIEAASTRYTNAAIPDYARLARNYKHAMALLVERYPDDLDAATLYAESMMDLKPWALYTPAGDPVGGTQQILSVLESVMRRDPSHIGANHFYIHAVEASRAPQRALIAATRLGAMSFEPAAAHLVHMPAHIYMRTGDFATAVMTNEHATAHDRAYMAMAREDREASFYYDHNLTMLAAGYSMEGNYAGAERVARRLKAEGAVVPALFVPLRFQRWDEILAMPKPTAAPSTEPLRLAFWHFSRGVAFAAEGKIDGAARELEVVKGADVALHYPASPGNYNSSASLMRLAQDDLSARIAQLRGNPNVAIVALRRAVAAQDALIYIEPPDWYFPEREALGGALLINGQAFRALEVFRADLNRNPRNPRSLFGLSQALERLGRTVDAQLVRNQFQTGWTQADTRLTALW